MNVSPMPHPWKIKLKHSTMMPRQGAKIVGFTPVRYEVFRLIKNSYFPTRNYIICKFLRCPPATRRSTATLSLTNHYFD